MKSTKAVIATRSLLYMLSILIILYSLHDFKVEWVNIGQAIAALCVCILMNVMLVDIDGMGSLDFTDAVIAFVFFAYDYKMVVLFVTVVDIIVFFINGKWGNVKRKKSNIILSTSMIIIDTFVTSMIFKDFWAVADKTNVIELSMLVAGYLVVFLVINLSIFVTYNSITKGEWCPLPEASINLAITNCLISIITTSILVLVNCNYGLIGSAFVLVSISYIGYWIFTNNRLQVKNNVMKGIIKITKDIIKYGDFGEKCKYLAINLRELIPYSVCAIYSFNDDCIVHQKDEISYPIAFYKPDSMDIGDLGFTLPSCEKIKSVFEQGNINVTYTPCKDLQGLLSSDLLSQLQSAILVPVTIENRLSGLIFIGGDYKLMNFLSFGINDMLNILSNQMALAIENNNIYNSIKDSADIDSLTGLYNRNVFKREVQELIATRTKFSLVIYDIDDFKRVNDTYGHLVGDEMLKYISDEIKKSIRKTDVPCRYGGEEIVIIFKDLNKDDSVVISERIRERIEAARLNWYGNIVQATVSGGIASYPEDGKTVEDIIGKADKVLYSECKQKGKNKVFAYETMLSDTACV